MVIEVIACYPPLTSPFNNICTGSPKGLQLTTKIRLTQKNAQLRKLPENIRKIEDHISEIAIT